MKEQSGSTPNVNMISSGTNIVGALTTDNDIRISGNLDGEITTKGKIIVSKGGLIKGDVRAKEADIAGTIDGELEIEQKLILRQSAIVKGDIVTKSLLVEEGARFDGACTMGSKGSSENGKNRKNSKKNANVTKFTVSGKEAATN